jgi:hypothetical protein
MPDMKIAKMAIGANHLSINITMGMMRERSAPLFVS